MTKQPVTKPVSHASADKGKSDGPGPSSGSAPPAGAPPSNAGAAPPPSTTAAPWQQVVLAFQTHFDKPDLQAIRAVYASFAAHDFASGQPVWPLLVGPPGSLKTALLESLDGLPNVHIIDQITPKTFISGLAPEPSEPSFRRTHNSHKDDGDEGDEGDDGADKDDEQPTGLLFRIGPSGKIICADFSTILAINRDHRASILSDLRRIYDGRLRKEFGTGRSLKARQWTGRITFLAAGTGDVDRHYSVFASLGERFVLIRWPRAGMEAAQRAVKQDGPKVKREISEAAHLLFGDLAQLSPTVPPEMEEDQIPALGDFISYCRSPIVRDSRGGREIIDIPEAESATRISQQLCQLAKGSALLDRREAVNEEDWRLVTRVAFDCLPPNRRKVLDALIFDDPETQAQCDALPESTRRYATEELAALGAMEKSGQLSCRSRLQLYKAVLL